MSLTRYSVVALLAPNIFPPDFRDAHGGIALYFEAAAVITVLVLLGQVLELRARASTMSAIRALIELAPKIARRLRADGSDEDVPLDAVIVGDRLRVRPGEKIPVDGVLIDGRSAVDESMVTGELMPVSKEQGAKVIAGTLNRSGSFVMRAEKVGRDTLARPNRPNGRCRAALARTHRTARRSGRRMVRARRSSPWRSRRFWPGRYSDRSRASPTPLLPP